MLKVKEAFGGADGASRGRTVAWRISLVALILLAGGVTFALISNKATKAHAAKPATVLPVSTNWYFAEGRVGGGFREYLTLGNPDPVIDCTVQIEYLAQGSATSFSARKPMLVKTVVIPHASRYTASVNTDLGITEQQTPAVLLSAIVTVPSSACNGIVAERPMYFNYRGVQSGSDIMGASHLGSNFYFASVPTQAGSSSFMTSYLSILNPPTGSLATVTAKYYAAGHQVGMQTVTVAAGTRSTLLPDTLHLPTSVAAVVTSDQPVVVERSSYMYNMQSGVAGMVSSANSLLGAPMLYNHWLFAEGYTGGQTQEILILSNLQSIDTTATITLEYQNGHRQSFTGTVPAHSQHILDVNAANAHPTGTCDVTPCSVTPEVSADVTATSSSLVVERDMFFHYNHTVSGGSTVTAAGGSAVTGAMVATTGTTNFAEGYTNTGYNEWLTLQNPTTSSEQVTATLLNEYGRSYTQTITINAQGRSTVDITMLVKQHLVQSGDDARAYQVSMSVKAVGSNVVFVAERPMYFHTGSGIQGGTGVIGYNGLTPAQVPFISEYGTGISSASGPDIITTGPDGNIWFTEYQADKIARMTPEGVVTEFSTGISNGAELSGLTSGPDDNLWFTEYDSNYIGRITTAGVVTLFNTGLSNNAGPSGIVAGPDGKLWFTEYDGDRIGRITTAGVITEYSAGITASSEPNFITAGPDNNLWFTESSGNRIGRITTAGVVTEFNTGINANSRPEGIAAGPDGNLWFTEGNGNRIGRITTDGVVTEFSAGLTANSGLYMIAAGPDGNLWFTEGNGNRIGRITTSGIVTEFGAGITKPNSDPDGIALGPDGNMWFTEYNVDQLGRANMSAIPSN